MAIGQVFLENLIGLVVGILMGMLGSFINVIPHDGVKRHSKMIYSIACAVGFIVAGEKSKFTNTKYIASLTFGYVTKRAWNNDVPTKELGLFWWFIQPLFFGTVGAALVFK